MSRRDVSRLDSSNGSYSGLTAPYHKTIEDYQQDLSAVTTYFCGSNPSDPDYSNCAKIQRDNLVLRDNEYHRQVLLGRPSYDQILANRGKSAGITSNTPQPRLNNNYGN